MSWKSAGGGSRRWDELRTESVSPYALPGTLSTLSPLDGNTSSPPTPYWTSFQDQDLPDDHGRLLEQALLYATSSKDYANPFSSPPAYLAGKTILLIGDSNERGLVDDLCTRLGSYPSVMSSTNPPALSDRWHADAHTCEIPALDLRLASFMAFGVLIEEGNDLWSHKVELDGPWSIEERIELAKRFMSKWGHPAHLVVFNSNLWDLMFLHDTRLRAHRPYRLSLTLPQVHTWIDRASVALSHLRDAFPSTPLSFRTLHPLWPGGPNDFFNSHRTQQLHEATRVVLRRAEEDGLDVRLLDVGRVLEGMPTTGDARILRDKVHLGWSPGLWMYSEMMLEALKGRL
ncbi:hypothetical protein JCM1841_003250 [Sporobolomyces salmonicolor]